VRLARIRKSFSLGSDWRDFRVWNLRLLIEYFVEKLANISTISSGDEIVNRVGKSEGLQRYVHIIFRNRSWFIIFDRKSAGNIKYKLTNLQPY
jgi:hypothetical protein